MTTKPPARITAAGMITAPAMAIMMMAIIMMVSDITLARAGTPMRMITAPLITTRTGTITVMVSATIITPTSTQIPWILSTID